MEPYSADDIKRRKWKHPEFKVEAYSQTKYQLAPNFCLERLRIFMTVRKKWRSREEISIFKKPFEMNLIRKNRFYHKKSKIKSPAKQSLWCSLKLNSTRKFLKAKSPLLSSKKLDRIWFYYLLWYQDSTILCFGY